MTDRRRLWPLALAAGIALAPLPGRAQDPTLAQNRTLAADLIDAGELDAARAVTQSLLDRDPDDLTALILAARLATAEGRFERAAQLGALVFRATEEPRTRFVAARLAARATFEAGQFSRAQIWLRRARQLAPDADAARAVAEDYQVARRLNPLAVDLRFGLRPSSNVNNGTQSDRAFIGGLFNVAQLTRDAKALSGLAFDLGGTAQYRVSNSRVQETFVDVALDGTTYALSADARDELEAAARDQDAAGRADEAAELRHVEGSDYAYVQLSFGVSHQRVLTAGARPVTFAARIGKSWYGGSPYTQFLDASVGQTVQLGDRSLLQLFTGVQRTIGADDRDDNDSLRLGGSLSTLLADDDVLTLSLSGRTTKSDNGELEYNSVLVGVNYRLDRPVFGAGLSFGGSIERRNFGYSPIQDGPRRDETFTLTAEAVVSRVEYYGFRPVARLEVSRMTSDNALFDREYVSLGVDLRSAF